MHYEWIRKPFRKKAHGMEMTRFTPDIRHRLELTLDEMKETGEPPREVLRHAADLNVALEEIHRLRTLASSNEA